MQELGTINRISVITICLLMAACYYDVEEELYPQVGCFSTDMSFSNDILPIIESNCFPCHDALTIDGNINLEGYDRVKVHIDNGRLVGAITYSPGFSPMPQGKPKLLDCDIEKIQSWVNDGAPNN